MMHPPEVIDISYFPGCSLATTAKENNQSLIEVCYAYGISPCGTEGLELLRQFFCSQHQIRDGISVVLPQSVSGAHRNSPSGYLPKLYPAPQASPSAFDNGQISQGLL
jgi:hypothetical protein